MITTEQKPLAEIIDSLKEYRKIFLVWGLIFAVFLVRGVLPFLIVWFANPAMPFGEMFRAVFSGSQGPGYLKDLSLSHAIY